MPDNPPPLVAGVELGGTKAIALVARGQDILAMARMATEAPAPTLAALSDQIAAWSGLHGQPEAIGIASFGPLALDRTKRNYGRITRTPKPGWNDTDVVRHFKERFVVPVGFDTDVNGAALAEYRWGAAQGCDVTAYLTIGTGIGAGILVAGSAVHGLGHAEFGHVRVRRAAEDPFPGICPFHGDCLEGLISGPAIAERAGVPGDSIDDDHPVLAQAMDELAEALAQLLLTLSPQRILIGGGVMQARPQLFRTLRSRVSNLLQDYPASIAGAAMDEIIAPPGLADLAGPLGAVAIAQRELENGDLNGSDVLHGPNGCAGGPYA